MPKTTVHGGPSVALEDAGEGGGATPAAESPAGELVSLTPGESPDVPEDTPEYPETPVVYGELTVAELRDIARERGLVGFSTWTKAELVQVLVDDDLGGLV